MAKSKAGKTGSQQDIRAFRSQVAALKRKGLIPKSVDARKAQPTRDLKRAVNSFADVLDGRASVWKVGRKEAAKLKAEGFTVKNSRVVTSKSMHVRKGRVFGLGGGEVMNANGDVETAARIAFQKAGKNNYVTFRVGGNSSGQTYLNESNLMADLLRDYRVEARGHITFEIVKADKVREYSRKVSDAREIKQEASRKRRLSAAKAKRVADIRAKAKGKRK